MSVPMFNACKFVSTSPTQKLVLMTLADCHNGDNGRCDPSVAYIIQVTGLSNRAIADALAVLESSGIITINRRFGARHTYTIHPTGEPSSRVTSEPASPVREMAPVNLAHDTSEPRSHEPVNLAPKPVSEAHTNRKNQNGTGKEPESSGTRVQKTDWRAAAKAEADEASATPLPLLWSQPLRGAVLNFFAHRHDLATKRATKTACKPWTVRAAESTVSAIEHAVTVHGEPVVLARIQSAISGGWQGLNLDSIRINGPPQRPQQRNDRGQRAGEIPTDFGASKTKDL